MRHPRIRLRGCVSGASGQGLVEFSLVLIPFLLLLMGVADLGRGIYVNNAVAQAAREIARTTSVHMCAGSPCTAGAYSSQTQDTINTQKVLVPGMTDSSVVIDCTNVTDTQVAVASGSYCPNGNYVRVKVTVPFSVLTPLLPVPKDFSLSSVSHIQIP